jgi:hypothetical protein
MVFAFLAFPWVGGVGFLGRKYKELIGTRARKNTENFVFFRTRMDTDFTEEFLN